MSSARERAGYHRVAMSVGARPDSWRNVVILSASQALAASAGPFVMLSGGIVGERLAPSPLLATLPITALIVGLACATVPVSAFIHRVGRRAAFVTGAAVSSGASLLAAQAVASENFAAFCASTFVLGAGGACVQQYRFAAAESVDARHTGRAVSLVLVGGIIAGAIGPEIARRGRQWFGTEFSGAFVLVAIIQIVAMAVLASLRMRPAAAATSRGQQLGLGALFAHSSFVLAVAGAGSASAVMSFLMTATPISMHVHDALSIDEAAFVIQSHVIAMYAPSLVTGWLVDRLGVARMMAAGVAAIGGAISATAAGHTLAAYWMGLVLLGLGWNLLFIGATVLVSQSFGPPERFRAQGLNDLVVFSSQAVASLAAGAVLYRFGWVAMNLMAAPLLLLVLVLIARRER